MEAKCINCLCPTQDIIPQDCRDKIIYREGSCPAWKPAPRLFNPASAENFIKHYFGLSIARVTIIAWARKHKIGRQIGQRWFIDPAKLKKHLGER